MRVARAGRITSACCSSTRSRCACSRRARRSPSRSRRGPWLGALNAVGAPVWLALAIAIVLLDLAIYFQHVMFHAVPTLWRLHRVHHADLDFDVTTGTALPSHRDPAVDGDQMRRGRGARRAGARRARVRGPAERDRDVQPRERRAAGECSTAGCAGWWSRRTCTGCTTRCSTTRPSSNFGFNLPWWDRLFGTYRAQPAPATTA